MQAVDQATDWTDADLVERSKLGDRAAFDELYHRHYARVANFAMQLLDDRSMAGEIALDAFQTAFESIPRIREGQGFLKFLFRVVVNAVRYRARRQRRWRLLSLDSTDEAIELVDEYADLARTVERHAVDRALRKAIAALPIDFREVLVLHHLQNVELEQASQILGAPVGTLKSRLSRARARLRADLAPWLDQESVL